MAESHVISALIKKRSELSGEIEHYEKIIKEYRNNLASIDKTIHIFDQNYDLRTVKSKRVIRNSYFSSGEATKMVLDVLRTADKPIKTDNLIDILADTKLVILLIFLKHSHTISQYCHHKHHSFYALSDYYNDL